MSVTAAVSQERMCPKVEMQLDLSLFQRATASTILAVVTGVSAVTETRVDMKATTRKDIIMFGLRCFSVFFDVLVFLFQEWVVRLSINF